MRDGIDLTRAAKDAGGAEFPIRVHHYLPIETEVHVGKAGAKSDGGGQWQVQFPVGWTKVGTFISLFGAVVTEFRILTS